MNLEEFKARIRNIDSEHSIFVVQCGDCMAYAYESSSTDIITGWADWKESQEFYKLVNAKAAIELHKDTHSLHRPRILSKVTEYLTHTSRHMIRYRTVDDSMHVYSVNGCRICHDKCAFSCKTCGAIYESKALNGRSVFPIGGPRCNLCFRRGENRIVEDNLEKICICPDLFELGELEEERLHQEWCKANPEKATKCHICCLTPKSNHPENVGWRDSVKGWTRFRWSGDIDGVYEEKLVCEDCYYTSSEYKTHCGPKARRRYLGQET